MELRYYPVRPDLREFFGVYYVFESSNPVFQPICAELGNIRFVLDGGGRVSWPDGREKLVPNTAVVGPTMSAYAIDSARQTRVFGVGVLPYGWDALFRFSAEELTDDIEDLSACLGPSVHRLHDQLLHAQSELDCVTIMDTYLGAVIENRAPRRRFPAQLEQWLLKPETSSIDDLLGMMDVSRRQTDRLAKYYFGASPKALQRKYRALHALTRLSLGETSHWYDASGEGYYDQSHFIKEFKLFVGATPTEFMRESAILMAHSIRLRARATHKPPLSSL